MSSPQCPAGRSSIGGYSGRNICRDLGEANSLGTMAAPAGSAARKETKDKMPRARKLPCGHWPTQPTGPEPFLPECWVRLAEPQEDPPLLGETLSQPQKGHPSSCSGTASAWERAVPFPVLQPLEWGVPPPLCKTFRDWALLLLLPGTPPTLLGPADPRDG